MSLYIHWKIFEKHFEKHLRNIFERGNFDMDSQLHEWNENKFPNTYLMTVNSHLILPQTQKSTEVFGVMSVCIGSDSAF